MFMVSRQHHLICELMLLLLMGLSGAPSLCILGSLQ